MAKAKSRAPITAQPGLPRCSAPIDGGVCGEPAIAKVVGLHEARHLCDWHVKLATEFYAGEPLRKREDIEYITARKRTTGDKP